MKKTTAIALACTIAASVLLIGCNACALPIADDMGTACGADGQPCCAQLTCNTGAVCRRYQSPDSMAPAEGVCFATTVSQ